MSEHRAASAVGLAPEGPPAAWQRTGLPPSADSALGPAGIRDEDDVELESHMARWAADIEAGRCRIPDESELEGPAISISLGDACDLDPALLAAMCGPDGLGGTALSAAFGQDKAADVLRPGPVLAALTEQAVSDLATLSDDQLTGALSAARRLENRAAYLQTIVIAEFARRREVEREQAKSRKVPLHCRPGQFPGEELAEELVSTVRYADERIWEATDLATRLPRTLAGMADGTIDSARAYVIWSYTWSLIPRDAAHADELLAAAAPGLRPDQLARKAAALEMKLDPEAVKRSRAAIPWTASPPDGTLSQPVLSPSPLRVRSLALPQATAGRAVALRKGQPTPPTRTGRTTPATVMRNVMRNWPRLHAAATCPIPAS